MFGTSYLSLPEFNIINKIIFISRQHKPQFISIIRSQSYHKFWHTHNTHTLRHSHFLAYFPHRAIEMKARHQVSGEKGPSAVRLWAKIKNELHQFLSDEPGRRGRRGRACAPFLIYFWHFRNDTDVFFSFTFPSSPQALVGCMDALPRNGICPVVKTSRSTMPTMCKG